MEAKDLRGEQYREYVFGSTVYRIDKPISLYIGRTTHRVVDSLGIVHCVPAVGEQGCVLRWLPVDAADPVQF